MNWAHHAILKLEAGQQATINPRGSSMKGKVESGDTVVVAPLPMVTCSSCRGSGSQQERASCVACDGQGEWPDLEVGDIVLVKVQGRVYLHLITKINGHGNYRYMISNNRGHDNGWVRENAIFGVAISVAGKVVKEIKGID